MLPRQKPRLPDPATVELPPIAEDPQYRAALGELTALEQRLAETDERRQRALARLRGTKSTRSPLERARDLLAGGEVGAVDPRDDIAAADEERFRILQPAIIAASQQLDEISRDLSYEASKKLQPIYAAALSAALQAMGDLCAAFDAAAAIRARLHGAGYQPSEIVLPFAAPPGGIAALDARNPNGWAWFWKQMLIERGIL